ncbi:hypothetical protein SprV_0301027700 [Sparganum proliferum]
MGFTLSSPCQRELTHDSPPDGQRGQRRCQVRVTEPPLNTSIRLCQTTGQKMTWTADKLSITEGLGHIKGPISTGQERGPTELPAADVLA